MVFTGQGGRVGVIVKLSYFFENISDNFICIELCT